MKKRFWDTHKTNIKYSHIYSHLDNKAKRDHIQLTKGHHILQHHLNKTTARKLNEVCDKEATLQHTNNTQLTLPIKPQVISIKVKGTQITSKNLNIIHSLTNSQKLCTIFERKIYLGPGNFWLHRLEIPNNLHSNSPTGTKGFIYKILP